MNLDELFAKYGDDYKSDMAKSSKVDVSKITDQMVKDQLAKGWIYDSKGIIRCLSCDHQVSATLEKAKLRGTLCMCGNKMNFS